MKTSLPPQFALGHVALGLVALGILLPAGLAAQEAAPLPIALLNTDKVFKTHPPFQDKLAPIREAAVELDKTIQLRSAELETVVNKLRGLQPGTPEAQKLQQQGAKLQSDLQQFIQKERGDLQKREAGIFLELYRELETTVKKYAQEHNIKLVIRQHDSSLDDNQPVGEIVKAINRGIVYEEGLDITDEILMALGERSPASVKP